MRIRIQLKVSNENSDPALILNADPDEGLHVFMKTNIKEHIINPNPRGQVPKRALMF